MYQPMNVDGELSMNVDGELCERAVIGGEDGCTIFDDWGVPISRIEKIKKPAELETCKNSDIDPKIYRRLLPPKLQPGFLFKKKSVVDESEDEVAAKLKQLHNGLFIAQQNEEKILEMSQIDLIMQTKSNIKAIQTLHSKMSIELNAAKKCLKNLEKIGINVAVLDADEFTVEHLVDNLMKVPKTFEVIKKSMLDCNKEIDFCVVCEQKEFGVSLMDITQELKHLQNDFSSFREEFKSLKAENDQRKIDSQAMEYQVSFLTIQQAELQKANAQLEAQKVDLEVKLQHLKVQNDSKLEVNSTFETRFKKLRSGLEELNNEMLDITLEMKTLKDQSASDEKTIMELNQQCVLLKKKNFTLEQQTIKQSEEIKAYKEALHVDDENEYLFM